MENPTSTPNYEAMLSQATDLFEKYQSQSDTPEREIIWEVVDEIVADSKSSFVEHIYYAERLIFEIPPVPQSAISDHLIEDAGTDPPNVATQLFKNALSEYLRLSHLDDHTPPDEPTETPPQKRPTVYDLSHDDKEFRTLLDQIYPGIGDSSHVAVNDRDQIHELKHSIGTSFQKLDHDWTWTKHGSFIHFLRSNTDKVFYIPDEQISNVEFIDIISSLSYWSLMAYIEDNTVVADKNSEN